MATQHHEEIELEELHDHSSLNKIADPNPDNPEPNQFSRSKTPIMRVDSWYDRLMVFKPLGLEKFDT